MWCGVAGLHEIGPRRNPRLLNLALLPGLHALERMRAPRYLKVPETARLAGVQSVPAARRWLPPRSWSVRAVPAVRMPAPKEPRSQARFAAPARTPHGSAQDGGPELAPLGSRLTALDGSGFRAQPTPLPP